MPKLEAEVIIAGALLLAALYLAKKASAALSDPATVQGAAAGVASGAVTLAGNVATGAVLGIGDAVGLPRTSLSACQQAQAEGRWLDASFVCPAGDFISGGAGAAWGGVKSIFN